VARILALTGVHKNSNMAQYCTNMTRIYDIKHKSNNNLDRSSTSIVHNNPANLAKISLVDVEIINLTEIDKIETAAERKPTSD